MPVPPISELESATRQLVWKAKSQGNLKEFTPRLVRRALEKEYELEVGALDESGFKSAIKAAASKAALNASPPKEEEEEEGSAVEAEGSPPKKNKKNKKKRHQSSFETVADDGDAKAASTSKAKRKAKEKARVEEEAAEDDELGSAKKKRKVMRDEKSSGDDDVGRGADKSSPPRRNPNAKGREQRNAFKSAELVFSSDVEHEEPTGSGKPKPSPSKTMTPDKPASRVKPSSSLTNLKGKVSEESGAKSESELSVLDDVEPAPKRKKKSKSADKESKKPSKSKGKANVPTGNKDEDTIKRLKSLVVACGVRKVWSKVFQGLDTPPRQIRKLKEMLAELGMTGRMSMEQAKAVKERRELAQELEDVQAFATAIEGGGGSRASRSRFTKGGQVQDQISSDEQSSDDPPMAARKSIMAFLEDQSSDDE